MNLSDGSTTIEQRTTDFFLHSPLFDVCVHVMFCILFNFRASLLSCFNRQNTALCQE